MAINSSTREVVTKKLLKIVDTKVNTSVFAENGVDKILSTSLLVGKLTPEKFGDGISISGDCKFSISFLNQDKQFEGINTVVDFSEKLLSLRGENICVSAKVENVSGRKSGGAIELVANISLLVYGTISEQINLITAGNENCIEKLENIAFEKVVASKQESFEIVEEFDASDKIEKVIAVNKEVIINKQTAFDGYVTIEGEILKEIVYVCDDLIKKINKSVEFSQEIAITGIKSTNKIETEVRLVFDDAVATSTEETNKFKLVSTSMIEAIIYAYEEEEINVVTDIFSFNKKLLINSECFYKTNFNKTIDFSDRINLQQDMSSRKRIDEVLYIVATRNKLVKSNFEEDKFVLESVSYFDVVYKNYDNEEVCGTVVEVPINLTFALNEDLTGKENISNMKVRCVGFKNKAGKELSLSLEIEISSNIFSTTYECFVSKVSEDGERERNNNSIVIYKSQENEKLFDIAKGLNVSPEIILAQNPAYVEGKKNKLVVFLKK